MKQTIIVFVPIRVLAVEASADARWTGDLMTSSQMTRLSDVLTPRGATILQSNGTRAYTQLVVSEPDEASRIAIEMLAKVDSPAELFQSPIKRPDDANAALAALWLWHDELDRSHTISQSIASETGSFWHAIMHRREGDFSNAKYWYARCRHHPVRADLPVHVESMIASEPSLKGAERLIRSGWDADGFVDLVRDVNEKPADDARRVFAVKLQQVEWMALFEYSGRSAIGQ